MGVYKDLLAFGAYNGQWSNCMEFNPSMLT